MKTRLLQFAAFILWGLAIALLPLAFTTPGPQWFFPTFFGGACLMAALEITKAWLRQP